MMKNIPKAIKGNQYTGKMVGNSAVTNQMKPKEEVIRDFGFTPMQVARFVS